MKVRRRSRRSSSVPRTLQKPGVEGDDPHHLHAVVGQHDPEAQQQEGDVLVDAGAHDVQRGDDQHHQQQRRLVAGDRRTGQGRGRYCDSERWWRREGVWRGGLTW